MNDKIAILGSGNIGLALAKGLVNGNYCKAGNITLTRRNVQNLAEYASDGFVTTSNNIEAVKSSSIIILGILPQQLKGLLSEIESSLTEDHLVVSIMSGVSCADIQKKISKPVKIVRAMPNTAISIGQSMTCIASESAPAEDIATVTKMFETVGSVSEIHEDLIAAATALCACGIAFFLRSIRAATQGGVEIGFHAEEALKMAVQTAKGAADLLLLHNSHPEHEIDKVTSPKGSTIAGLNEMEHQGFSAAMIKGIKVSAMKAGGTPTKE